MIRSTIFYLLGCLIIFQACQPAPQKALTEEEKESIANAIAQRVDDYSESIKQLDLNGIKSFFLEGEDVVLAPDGILNSGSEAVSDHINGVLKRLKKCNKLKTWNPHIYILSRDAGVCTYEFESNFTTETDDTIKFRGSWTYVFKQINGEWKIIHSTGTHVPITDKANN